MELREAKTGKIVFARLYEDEDLLETITSVAKQSKISSGFFSLIGTLKKARLGFLREGNYEPVEMTEPLEIVSCMGNISLKERVPIAHLHMTVSNEKGQASVVTSCLDA